MNKVTEVIGQFSITCILLITYFPSEFFIFFLYVCVSFSNYLFFQCICSQVLCRLVTKDTVDENVYEIAKRKLILDAAVLESGVELDNEGGMPEKTMGEILSSLLLG